MTGSIITPYTEEVLLAMDSNVGPHQIRTESGQFSIQITQSECTNTMFGKISPYSDAVGYDTNTEPSLHKNNGCGFPIRPKNYRYSKKSINPKPVVMKKVIILSLTFLTIIACRNNTKIASQKVTKEENTAKEAFKKSILEIGCYEYNNDGNVIKMEITEMDNNVNGTLNIAYAQKDASQGKFIGILNDDKLMGTYTFNSEGLESSREMVFLVKDDQLIEGYGELNENGTKFKDVNTIKYTALMPLTKVDCDK